MFSDADAKFSRPDEEIVRNNRAGWWRDGEARRVYLFHTEGLREALMGFDFGRALDVLQQAGALPKPDEGGERAKPQRICGRLARLYPIVADKLHPERGA